MRSRSYALGFGVAFVVASACSAGGGGSSPVNNAGGSSGNGTGGTGAPFVGTGGSSVFEAGPGDGAGGFDDDAACAAVSAQGVNPAVDIIWAVDNSGSMSDDIERVRDNINDYFVQIISQSPLDYQVIMISEHGTDGKGICVGPPLGVGPPSCGHNPPRFHHIACEISSHNALSALLVTFEGVQTFPPLFPCNLSLTWRFLVDGLRYDATKVFVVVTDDEAEAPHMVADQFDSILMNPSLNQLFGTDIQRRYIFHAIIGADKTDPTQVCTSPTNTAVDPGLQYQKLAALTGGVVESICEEDWSSMFQTMASGIVNRLACEYIVPEPPDGSAINPDMVNVEFTSGGGQPEQLPQDNNAGCDEGADGWQWNADHTKVLLCGPTCERVRSDANGKIIIKFGCRTNVKPPA